MHATRASRMGTPSRASASITAGISTSESTAGGRGVERGGRSATLSLVAIAVTARGGDQSLSPSLKAAVHRFRGPLL